MVDQAAINRRQRQFEDKGKAEILLPPEGIDQSYLRAASAHRIRVVNKSGGILYGNRFAKINGYDIKTKNAELANCDSSEAGLARLEKTQIVTLISELANNAYGLAWVGGIQKIEIRSVYENINIGDLVGPEDTSGKAIKFGPFTCVYASGNYVWVNTF